MVVIPRENGDGSLRIRGKLGRPGLPDPLGIGGIYQMRPRKNGPIQVKQNYYAPTGEPGSGQVLQRHKMRTCVVNWHGLDTDTQKEYKRRAKAARMTGFNYYLRDCLRFVEVTDFWILLENSNILLLESGSKILL